MGRRDHPGHESQCGSGGIQAIHIYGELRFRRANSAPRIVHGAIHTNNPDTVAPLEDVLITGPVLAVDTGINRGGVPFLVQVHRLQRRRARLPARPVGDRKAPVSLGAAGA